jgi:hypothetical protein
MEEPARDPDQQAASTVPAVEHFLLPDLVVLRDVDAKQFDDEQRPDLVLGGLTMKALAQFRVADRRCRAGIADSAPAFPIVSQVGAPTDLRGRAATAVKLGGVPFEMWQLPEWWVGDASTILHLVLVSDQYKSVSREAHRELLGGLHIQHGDAPVLPVSMGTFGGDGLIQCMAEFGGQLTGLRATIEQVDHEA